MAMRRIWVLMVTEPTTGDERLFQIEDDGDTRKPAVFRSLDDAQAEANDFNEDMQAAVSRGDLEDYEEVQPHDAWLLDETGVISLDIVEEWGVRKIADLQLYCETNGQV